MCLTVKLPKNHSNNPNMPTTSKNTECVHASVPDTILGTPPGLPPFTLAFLPLTVKETAAQVKITASNGGYQDLKLGSRTGNAHRWISRCQLEAQDTMEGSRDSTQTQSLISFLCLSPASLLPPLNPPPWSLYPPPAPCPPVCSSEGPC